MQKKIALVLSGGGARGIAHIGVIEELTARGYEITGIAGTSMGAMVGGIYAAGKLQQFKEWLLNLNRYKAFRLLDFAFQSRGLISGNKIFRELRGIVPDRDIQNLDIHFTAVATDILNNKEVVFQEGSLLEAIRASIGIPTVFVPVQRDGMLLCDGGLVNNLPVNHIRKKENEPVFAVNVNAFEAPFTMPIGKAEVSQLASKLEKTPQVNAGTHEDNLHPAEKISYRWIIQRSLNVLIEKNTMSSVQENPPDLLMNISEKVAGRGDFLRAAEIIENGRYCTARYLDEYERKFS